MSTNNIWNSLWHRAGTIIMLITSAEPHSSAEAISSLKENYKHLRYKVVKSIYNLMICMFLWRQVYYGIIKQKLGIPLMFIVHNSDSEQRPVVKTFVFSSSFMWEIKWKQCLSVSYKFTHSSKKRGENRKH